MKKRSVSVLKSPSAPLNPPPVTRPREATPAPSPVRTAAPSLASFAPGEPAEAAERIAVRFGLFQPDAHDVHLVGSFNGWNPRATPLRRDPLGDWSVELLLPPGEYRYRFLVDGAWHDDPSAQQTAMNPFGGFDAVLNVYPR